LNKYNSAMITLILIPVLSFAAETILKKEIHSSRVPQDQNVESFRVRVQHKRLNYKFADNLPYFMTKMVAEIKVKDPKDLKDYGIVQFNRGCIFNSDTSGNLYFSMVKNFFGDDQKLHVHKDWVIDSIDEDPLYWSSTEPKGRLSKYRLNDPMISARDVKPIYMSSHSNKTTSYVRDMPTGASFYEDKEYVNTSLEFKTCLYKISDLPSKISPTGEEIIGKELKCFNWKSIYIYDADKKSFQMQKTIHPFCLK